MIDYALVHRLYASSCELKEDVDDSQSAGVIYAAVAERGDQELDHLVAEDLFEKAYCLFRLLVLGASPENRIDLLSYCMSTFRVKLMSFPSIMSFRSSACS